jgi:hemolysin activation/secretion protein
MRCLSLRDRTGVVPVVTVMKVLALLGVLFFIQIFCSYPVFAQSNDAAAEAARAHEKRLQEDALRRQKELEARQQSPDVFLQPQIDVSDTDEPDNKTCFNIQHIQVQGVLAFDKKQIDGLIHPYLNQCLGLAEINRLIKSISNLYIAKGWVTSRAFLQPQNLADGTLDILVVEGQLETLESVEGSLTERQLRWAFPVEEGRLLNLRDLEQGLEQLNRLQQNRSELDIQPGSTTGASRALIRNNIASQIHIGAGFNNSGSEATGETLATAYVSWDNPFNSNDNVFLNVSDAISGEDPAKSRSYSMAYSVPYGYALFSYSGSYFEYEQLVKGVAVDFLTSGSSANHTLNLDYMLYRGQRDKLALGLGFTRKQSKNYLEDVFLDTSSRILYLWDFGPTYTRPLANGLFNTSVKWYRSVNWGDAKTELVSAENDFQFNKYTLDSNLTLNFNVFDQQFSYQTSAYLFYSPEAIIASEALSLGGRYSIRGVEGEGLFGYRGGYWRNQIALVHPFKFGGRMDIYAGVDVGQSDTPDNPDINNETLVGSAVGVVLSAAGVNLDIAYARALKVPDYLQGAEHGIYASLQANF